MFPRRTWDFPDEIKFRVAPHTISEKAIGFQHPGYNQDRAQKLISSSVSRHLSTRNISSKSMHPFLSNLANRQTSDKRGQTHLPPPLSEVMTRLMESRMIYRCYGTMDGFIVTKVYNVRSRLNYNGRRHIVSYILSYSIEKTYMMLSETC